MIQAFFGRQRFSSIRAILSLNPRVNPVGVTLLGLAVLYVAVIAAPNLLFGESVSAGAVEIYSHHRVPGMLSAVAIAEQSLAKSPINDIEVPQRIFLTQSTSEFTFFAPAAVRAFGATYPAFSDTFLALTDDQSLIVHANRDTLNRRPLSAVIAHERMHVLLTHHFGLLRSILAPTWKQEGYCEYIAGGHSVGDDAAGLRLLSSPLAGTPESPTSVTTFA